MPSSTHIDMPPARPDGDLHRKARPHHIGNELRARRLAMGLSPQDVASALKIRPDYILAIEALDVEALPAIGYALGYVRAFAGHVGLSGTEAVSRYKLDSAVPDDLGRRKSPHFVPKTKIRLPRGLVPALTVLGCAAVLTIWYAGSAPVNAAPTPLSELIDAGEYVPQTLPEDPDVLTLKAVAPSWVQVNDPTGRVVMSRIMVTGEIWTTQRGNLLSLAARDGAAIELYAGRERLGAFGEKGVPFSGKAIAPETLTADLEDAPEETPLTQIIPQ